jgi:uncharacterized integral membrane protein (TIGR00697 family)
MKKIKQISFMQMLLSLVFVVSLLVSNIIASKQIQLPFGIVMTAAVVVFPITYILSDVFSEVYGYKWSRITCYMGFAMNLFMVILFTIAVVLPAPSFFEGAEAFKTVLSNTPRVLFASSLAFVVGDFINDKVFKAMKIKYKDSHKKFTLRAIVSSFCGEIVDSSIFLPIVFLGTLPMKDIAIMIGVQVLLKTSYEIVILPATTQVVKKVSRYEKKLAEKEI